MGFNLQLGDVLRSGSVTAIDDAIREIVRQEIARTPRSKFCESCAYMHQPEISARCCCVACHGDDVPAWAQRMNVTTPLSSEKTGEAHHQSHVAPPNSATASSPASPVKPCPFCGGPARLVSHESPEATNYGYEVHCDKCGAMGPSADCEWDGNSEHAKRDAIEAWNRRTPAPSPATGESAIDKALDPNCWDLAMQADTLAAARAELASLRAEVERLRTALAEKEKAGVDVSLVEGLVASCERWARSAFNDLISMHEAGTLQASTFSPEVKDLVPRIVALRTALGAKEAK